MIVSGGNGWVFLSSEILSSKKDLLPQDGNGWKRFVDHKWIKISSFFVAKAWAQKQGLITVLMSLKVLQHLLICSRESLAQSSLPYLWDRRHRVRGLESDNR